MVLTERLGELKDQITLMNEIAIQASNAKAYSTRANSLEEASNGLGLLADILDALRERQFAVEGPGEMAAALKSRLAEIREAFEEDVQTIVQSNPDLKHQFWKPLKDFPEKLRESLDAAWKIHIEKVLPSMEGDVLDVLGQVEGLSQQVQLIRDLMAKARSKGESLPTEQTVFDEVDEIVENLSAAWASLQGDGIPEKALEFLKKVGAGGASLDDLSSDVGEWLEQRDLKSAFKIVLG